MMNQVMGLFNGPTQTPAIVLAVVAFALGAIATCLGCKLFCPCGKKKACETKKKPQAKGAKAGEKPFEKRNPHPAPADGSIEIYVGNLSYDFTEEQLREAFAKFGTVNSARIITNRYNNKSKGFGFVHMPNRAEADAACAALNDADIGGRKIKCNEAKNVA